jgi:hypothetical protein
MRKAVMPFVLSVGLIAVWAAPADAASTRAEYVAQVDPICQSFEGQLDGAFGALNTNFKRMVRAAKARKGKPFIRGIRRTVSSLNGLAGVHENLSAQIAAVPPGAADSGTVGSWLNYLREEAGFERGAAVSLGVFKFRQFQSQLRQADQALRSGQVAIAGFGFQVCGVAVF